MTSAGDSTRACYAIVDVESITNNQGYNQGSNVRG